MADLYRSTGRFLRAAAGALSLTAVLVAPGASAAAAQSIARIGDVSLTADDIAGFAKAHPQLAARIFASEKTLESVVQRELVRRALLEEAGAKGWDKRPEIAKAADAARDQVILNTYLNSVSAVPKEYPDDAAVAAYYEANRSGLTIPRSYHLAQIFIERPAQAQQVAAAAGHAADLAARARQAGADFAALAKAESADTATREKGGDTGWLVENAIAPAIREALPRLHPGEVSGALEAADGWHIVRLIELRPSSQATLEQARPVIVRKLRIDRSAQLRQAYVDALLRKTPPQIDAAALNTLRGTLK